jgi:uncharacterized Zn finger protein (UPF0148 family)
MTADSCARCGEPVVEGRLNCGKCGSLYPDLSDRNMTWDPSEEKSEQEQR